MRNILKGKNLKTFYWCGIIGIPSTIIILAKLIPNFKDGVAMTIAIVSVTLYILAGKLISKLIGIKNEIDNSVESLKKSDDITKEIHNIINDEGISILNGSFLEFKETLKSKKIELEDGQVKSMFYRTESSAMIFEEDNLITKKIRIKTINHISQALTGIGIFGTFLGIVKGLGNLNLDNAEAMKTGVAVLINGVKLSFNTSLYGILLSIILIFALKICSDLILESSYELVELIDRGIPIYTEENSIDVVVEELKKQRGVQEKLATDLAEEMGKRFNASLEENITNLSNNLEELILNMKEEFNRTLNSSSENNMEMLYKTLTPMLAKLDETVVAISKHQENSSDKFIQEMLGSLKETISVSTQGETEKLKNSMDMIASKNADMLQTFTEAMENMRALVEKQESLISNSTSSAETMNIATTSMSDLQLELQSVIGNLKEVNKNNDTSMMNINNSLDLIKISAEKQLEINKNLDGMLSKSVSIAKMQEGAMVNYNNFNEEFKGSLGNMKRSVEDMTNNMNIYKKAIESISSESTKISETLNSSYRDAARDLGEVNKQVGITLNKLEENILLNVDDIVREVRGTSKELKENHSKMNELTENMKNFAEAEKASQELWKNYKGSFESLNETINEGVEKYTIEIAKSTNQILGEYDNNIAEAINSLRKTMEELTEYSETIAESAEALVEKREKELV